MSENLALANHAEQHSECLTEPSEVAPDHPHPFRGGEHMAKPSKPTASGNRLFFGDNLTVLRDQIKDESADLIYLDPPFNSSASYNVLFKASGGQASEAQAEAFRDTWGWGESAAESYDDVMRA